MSHCAAARNIAPASGIGQYQRHRPEQTLLYRIVEEYYPAFLVHLEAQGKTLPAYVRREFEDYIDIEICSACGGAVKVIACIEDPVVIKTILPNTPQMLRPCPSRSGWSTRNRAFILPILLRDRKTAIARMHIALAEMVVDGIKTNIPLQQQIMDDGGFAAGGQNIHYLEKHMAEKQGLGAAVPDDSTA